MSKYDFSTIDPLEFELLVRDLLNKEFGYELQSFKPGRDKGVDLAKASKSNPHEIIVQVKHFLKSGFDKLLTILATEEKKKVDDLKPGKYILVTSVPLSLESKKKIKAVLEPHIQTTDDVHGQEDLNMYLEKNSEIIKQYNKLWLTSTPILSAILHNSVNARSKFFSQKIVKNISLYVKNKNYANAIDILEKHKFLLVTGLPGVGKTILSYILTYELLAQDFQLIYVDQEVKEAEDVFDESESVKQIFILDDFLGANYNEIINPKSTHPSIIAFIERVQATPNKYCILTTRINILSKAKLMSEKLRRSNLEISKMEIEIKDYDVYDKGRILYNHLFHNSLPIEYISQIFENKNYWKIIKHENYNPRIIEFITSINILSEVNEKKTYLDVVLYHLSNPGETWRHAFENQIENDDRYLLYSLFTFIFQSASNEYLEEAFNCRINYEIVNNGYQKSNDSFNQSIKRLLEGFIIGYRNDKEVSYRFVNPSLSDFLLGYFLNSKEERKKLIDSSCYFSQYSRIVTIYDHYRRDLKTKLKSEWIYLVEGIVGNGLDLKYSNLRPVPTGDSCKKILICNLLARMSWWDLTDITWNDKIDTHILKCLKEIDFDIVIDWDYDELIKLFNSIAAFTQSQEFLKPLFIPLVDKFIKTAYSFDQMKEIKTAFEVFELDLGEYISGNSERHAIERNIEEIISESVKEFISDEKHQVFTSGDFEKLKDKAASEWSSYNSVLDLDLDFDEGGLFSGIDEESLIEANCREPDGPDFDDGERESIYVETDEQKVDHLFSRNIN